MNTFRGIMVVAVLLVAHPATAKFTFNDVKKECWTDITAFLEAGGVRWSGHAYRVDVFSAFDAGRYLIRTYSGAVFETDYAFLPYRYVYALVGVRRIDYVNLVAGYLPADAVQTFNDKDLHNQREYHRQILLFKAKRATEAPIWYVFRRSLIDGEVAETMLFSMGEDGACTKVPYYPFLIKGYPMPVFSRQ